MNLYTFVDEISVFDFISAAGRKETVTDDFGQKI